MTSTLTKARVPMLAALAVAAALTACSKHDDERTAEDHFRITIAVAGFRRDEIEIVAQQNLLTVKGKKDKDGDQSAYLHLGIATRSFERRFELADFIRVEDARLNDGLLTIDLVREVPEALRPQTIAIKTGAPLAAIETTTADETKAA